MDVSKFPETARYVTGGNGSRAGLFRTPISGGVQSATSAHDLPSPALAVRNLMEQVSLAASTLKSNEIDYKLSS